MLDTAIVGYWVTEKNKVTLLKNVFNVSTHVVIETGITIKAVVCKIKKAIPGLREGMCIKVKVNYRKATGFWPLSKNDPAIEL